MAGFRYQARRHLPADQPSKLRKLFDVDRKCYGMFHEPEFRFLAVCGLVVRSRAA